MASLTSNVFAARFHRTIDDYYYRYYVINPHLIRVLAQPQADLAYREVRRHVYNKTYVFIELTNDASEVPRPDGIRARARHLWKKLTQPRIDKHAIINDQQSFDIPDYFFNAIPDFDEDDDVDCCFFEKLVVLVTRAVIQRSLAEGRMRRAKPKRVKVVLRRAARAKRLAEAPSSTPTEEHDWNPNGVDGGEGKEQILRWADGRRTVSRTWRRRAG